VLRRQAFALPRLGHLQRGPRRPAAVTVDRYSAGEAAHNTGFTISELGAADLGQTYVVTMKIGSMVPRIVDGWGRNGRTQRFIDADGDWAVRVTVEPAHMLMSCEYDPGVGDTACPGTAATADEIYNIGMRVSDAAWYADSAAERDKLWGLESYSDIPLFWYPPGHQGGRGRGDHGLPHAERTLLSRRHNHVPRHRQHAHPQRGAP
jgi:hypothetical protein